MTKASASSAILNIGYVFIDKRTIQKNALKDAIELFQNIVSITKNNGNDKVKECFLSAANGLLIAANHSGDKKTQEKVYQLYKFTKEELSYIPYFTRQENILSVRNRAYNSHFNDYRFQEIIDDFEDVLKLRISQLPKNEMDGLTGEMCGTIGQAYAFNSKNNKEFAKLAESYFKQSLNHFPVGHKYHAMSVNYLATLKWYHNDLEDAKSAFAKHADIDKNNTTIQLITQIIDSKEDLFDSIFNLSVLLRLEITQNKISIEIIETIEKFLEKGDINDHPYELIYKWLGIAYLKNRAYANAINQFDKSIELSNKLGFAVQTLSIPVIGLKYIALQKQNSENLIQVIEGLKKRTKELSDKSVNFANYIESIGGIEQMLDDIKNNKINSVSKWLPFNYA